MTQRDQQRNQRQQQSLRSALTLFVQKGYHETKIADIAQAANMSIGLLFHYFPSKERLLEELVKIGVKGTGAPMQTDASDPLSYFADFLRTLFQYAEEAPWVFQMFVLMSRVRQGSAMPETVKALAMQVDQMERSADLIRLGQERGYFREGDPYALSAAFWCSVQGVMEQHAITPELPLPEPAWLLDIIQRR